MDTTREDILIGRVTDGEATAADWTELEALAAKDPGVWSRLASEQRRHAALSAAVDDELTIAELVALPERGSVAAEAGISRHAMSHPSVRWRAYTGWAAAAALALAWVGADRLGVNAPRTAGPGNNTAGLITSAPPDELLKSYIDRGQRDGRVLMELPLVMVESGPAPDGKGTQVVYMRRLLEQTTVSGVYQVGRDETGQFLPVPAVQSSVPSGATRALRGL